MEPQENEDRYRQVIEAFERRDLDGVLTHIDPDAAFVPRSAELEGTSYRGHEGVRRWWDTMFRVFSAYRPVIEEVRSHGDLTFAKTRLQGRGMESGAPLEQTQWHVAEWRQGVIIRWRTFSVEAEALVAARLRDQ